MAGHFNHETNTWYDLKDVCGPMRDVIKIDEQSNGTFITMSCGHVGHFNGIFHYKATDQQHCYDCLYTDANVIRKEAR